MCIRDRSTQSTWEFIKVKNEVDEGREAKEQYSMMKRQYDILVNEIKSLKESLFAFENQSASSKPDSKISVVEEMQALIGEVIFVYKTLGTNSREFIEFYEEKKGKLEYNAEQIKKT
eukprot:TRINITY_DN5368_c0_g1_i1.p4 TRINITY_DN5368_c0_g1~~TRINITY_DN5368_c0_g1_i1.p4  ORF type:complete len:117 (-),score=29.13 TRINITY_DN5368_c0_g1_i1:295-645(-)